MSDIFEPKPEDRSVPENEPNPELISPTAKAVAYFRSFSDIPYSQEISDATNSGEMFNELSDADRKAVISFLAPPSEARYKMINAMIEKSGCKNVLEIASGVSPRGLVMTEDPLVNYVESDLPGILAEKQRIIEGILSKESQARANLHFATVNALDSEQMSFVAKSFDGPVAICNEGLMSYFNRQEKVIFAKNIRRILEEKGGVWISADFGSGSGNIGALTGSPAVKKFLDNMFNATGRDFASCRFVDQQDVDNFLEETGFEAEVVSQSLVADDLASIEKTGADADKIKSILANRKVYKLSPK
ncbi:MAG: hypothetical protein WC711_01790 [Candidatus Staskawiczbacteria bacterium]|jgi:O-methyltransferase involved in polyketide biosynthesis